MRAATMVVLLLFATAFAQEHRVGVLYYPEPVFPPIARQLRIHGDVVVELKLSEAGFVQEMTVVSGHPMLNQAALASLKKWHFICLDCKHYPEPITHRFTMTYILPKELYSCEPRPVRKAIADFPHNRMIVEASTVCIESDPDGPPAQEHEVGVNRYVIPKYPPLAKQARVEGAVVINLQLLADGSVETAEFVRGHPLLRPGVLETLRQWRFVCIDCRPGEKFSQQFTIHFKTVNRDVCVGYWNGHSPSLEPDWMTKLEFPSVITVAVTPVCIDTVSSN